LPKLVTRHNSLPVAGSKPMTAFCSLTTSSGPSGASTKTGVFQELPIPFARQTSLPVFFSVSVRRIAFLTAVV
jgi:hypothetical protein